VEPPDNARVKGPVEGLDALACRMIISAAVRLISSGSFTTFISADAFFFVILDAMALFDLKISVTNFSLSKDPGPEGPALVHPGGVMKVATFTSSVQVSGVSN
jgi:hypothetical protein